MFYGKFHSSSTYKHPEMDFQFSSNENRQLMKPNRKRLTQDQIRLLETSFNSNRKLQVDSKLELARRLGLPPRQVAIWYQNRRAREKIHTIEVDHKTIQLELDSVLAENRRLEQEVAMLKHELNKVQQMLSVANPITLLPSSTSQTYSSSPAYMIYSWENSEALPLEELYSCLISSEGQPKKQGRNDLPVHSVRF
ncbi:homeobox-leucine zipper protein ATHB-52-like [Mangifera indica]|uniref:homeobox-leucine zipper protein ATHB-52-like n=1 Tax=Mangifera indica TaxID=29780 RepID=UPI001CFBDBEE|nr:homeobox-leucine zipper protein ATHB-52-like [Mangifera indica]